jgi:hypothetical protein
MADYTINTAGSTTCNYPSTVNANDVLTFNITNKNTTTKYQGSMLTYTFPCDCTAEILAAGARGGRGAYVATNQAGYGAIVAGTFEFKTGDQLLICVGQAGTDHPYATNMTNTDGTVGAGGGGTYVVKKVSSSNYRYTGSGTGNNWYVEPLVIGAGGNGSGDNAYGGNTRVHGSSNQGNESSFSFSSSNNGGCFSIQPSSGVGDYNGYCFLKGAQGASSSYNRGGTSYAGFGGGSSNWDDGAYGSPGGGFTGGYVGDEVVYAATSYVATNATNISRKSGSSSGNNGEGYVKITFKTVVPLHEIPDGFVEKIKESNTQVKVDNAWKEVDKSFVKVNNAWKEIDKIYTKAKNSWIETGKNTFYHNNWVIHEGYISDSMFYVDWIGNATYSSYTPGEGIKLYTAKGSTSNQYPVAIGAISSVYWIVSYKDTWKVSFQRTSGNTEFEIGVALVKDTSILTTGRLNTTNFNSITKKHGQRFNVNNGVFTFCLKELFGEDYEEELYDFDTYLAFYLYSPTNASTTIKITSALDCFPVHCVMHEGALEDTSMTGYYTGHSTYSPYSSTGISLYKASGTSYPISIGCFNAPMDAKKIYSVGIAYEVDGTTVPNASLGFAYFDSQYNGRTDSSGPTTVQTRFVTTSPIDKLQGTVSLYIEDITDYTTLENVYFAVFLNSAETNSVTVKIKGIYFYISDDISNDSSETQTATLRLSNMVPASAYDSTWNNASYAYDTSSTTYASLSLTSVMTDEQQLKFAIDTALLNAISSVTKATLKIKMSYVLNSGSSPNVGVMLKDKSGNSVYYDDNFDEAAFDVLTIDITNSIPNSIDNGMILYGLYTSNLYSGAKGQINLYEAYIELEYGGETTTPDNIVYLVQNGVVNNNTIFGALGTASGITDCSSTTSGIGVTCSNSTSTLQCVRFSFGNNVDYSLNKVDSSLIEKMIIKWKFVDASIQGRTGELVVGWTSSVQTTWGDYSGYTNTVTNMMNFTTANTEYTLEFVPSNWSGENYLSFATRSRTANNAINYYITEIQVVMKDGTTPGGGTTDLVILKDTNMENSDIHGDVIWSNQRAIEYTENKGYVVTTNAQNYSKATFNNKINLSNYKSASVTIVGNDYYNMNDFYFGFYTSSSTTNIASKEDINTSSVKVVSTPKTTVIKKQEVTFDLDLSGFTGNTYYFGIWCYTSTATSFTITDIVLKTETSSGGGGTTTPTGSSIFPVKNLQVYNNTEFGALTTSSNVTNDSGNMGIKVVTSASNMYAYTTRFSFDKKFDMSKIEKIIMKWAYKDSSLAGRTGEIFIGCTSTTYNSQGNTNNFTGKLTKAITLSQGANVIDTIEFTPTNWTGENYLSIGVCTSSNNLPLTIGIAELEIVLKAGSGGSTGGLTLKQGYYNSTGDFISEPVYTTENIATDKISLKSVSNSASCMFTITCTQSLTCGAYLEVWSSDGTSGSYINYSFMGTKIFNPNQPQYVTFTKDDLASSMDLAGGFDIGHVALSIYTDNDDILISPSMFTVTFNR